LKKLQHENKQDVIVGVNKNRLEKEEPLHILEVDNQTVRNAQLARLDELKKNRNTTEVTEALAKLTAAGKSGNENLLALAVAN